MSQFNIWLETAIKNEEIKYYDYSEFEDPKYVTEGGFCQIMFSTWKNKNIVLKRLKGNPEIEHPTFRLHVREIQHLRRLDHPNIIKFFGVTKESSYGQYMIVLQRAEQGNLKEYLRNHFQEMEWSAKLKIALEMAKGLEYLHNSDIVHRDLHSMNILIHQGVAIIADLGLARNDGSKQSTNKNGIEAYIDYQVHLHGFSYRRGKRSDIYSLGVLLWEVSSGHPPQLSLRDIVSGKKEEIKEGTPPDYEALFTDCWQNEPKSRPDIMTVIQRLNNCVTALNQPANSSIGELFKNLQINDTEPSESDSRSQEHGSCQNCNEFNNEPAWCAICDVSFLKSQFHNWSSGDEDIDKFIQDTQIKATKYTQYLEFIPYHRFKDVEHLAEGGFSKVYCATWLDGARKVIREPFLHKGRTGEMKVVLKTFPITDKKYYLGELEAHFSTVNLLDDTLLLYGVTSNGNMPLMVLQYAEEGNLRHFLKKNFDRLKWSQKLHILEQISRQLANIHAEQYLHNDLHSGNILVQSEDKCYISDLGLATMINNDDSHNKGVFGVAQYLAPELFRNQLHSESSDVYALGIIMWELSSGVPAYFDSIGQYHPITFVLNVINGLRPTIVSNTPKCYVKLMEKCWDQDPAKRPSAWLINETVRKWRKWLLGENYYDNKWKRIESDRNIVNQFHASDTFSRSPDSRNTSTSETIDSEHYTSKFISVTDDIWNLSVSDYV